MVRANGGDLGQGIDGIGKAREDMKQAWAFVSARLYVGLPCGAHLEDRRGRVGYQGHRARAQGGRRHRGHTGAVGTAAPREHRRHRGYTEHGSTSVSVNSNNWLKKWEYLYRSMVNGPESTPDVAINTNGWKGLQVHRVHLHEDGGLGGSTGGGRSVPRHGGRRLGARAPHAGARGEGKAPHQAVHRVRPGVRRLLP